MKREDRVSEGNPVKDLQDRVASELPGSAVSADASLQAPTVPSTATADPLAQAIADIAVFYGRPAIPHALAAGLPVIDGRLPLEHAPDAAMRAGLRLSVSEAKLAHLEATDLPVLVTMREGDVEILWELMRDKAGRPAAAVMGLPGLGAQRVSLPFADLEEAAEKVIAVRPLSGHDGRGEEAVRTDSRGWFLDAFRDGRRIYAEAIAATLAVNVLALAMPLFSMNVYDRVLPNASESTLWALALGVGIAILFDFLIRTLRAGAVDAASRRGDARLSAMIYGRLLGARLSGAPASTGIRANTLREFETLREFLNSATLTAFGDLPFLALFLVVLWVVAGPLVWVVVAAIPAILGVGYLTQRALKKLIEASFKETAQKNAVATETIAGLESIKAAGAESWAALKWERAVAEHIRTGIEIRRVSNMGQHSIHALQTLVQVLVVVFGFYLVTATELSMGGLIAATILAGRALQPLSQAANLIARLNQTRMAYRSLTEIVQSPQERAEDAAYLAKNDIKGAIKFEEAMFAYAPMAAPALKAVTLGIEAGEHVAVIGGIGSGKSTALKLVQGLHAPTSGRVLVDGVSVGQIEPSLLRRQVALLLQDACLFHGTIRDNITMADASLSDDRLVEAARVAGMLSWVSRLPMGFDTAVRERGSGLSGGQRQAVALARAVASDPRVLLLDEPTSEMDGRTERSVIAALKAWAKGRTLIVVTHRPALLELADRLIVMDDGRIVQDGLKDDVLSRMKDVVAREASGRTTTTTVGAPPKISLSRSRKKKANDGGKP